MLPQGPLRKAIYTRLTTELSIPILTQRVAEGDAEAPLVLIQSPDAQEWGDLKNKVGYSLQLTLRVHTQYSKGRADLSERETLAEQVDNALRLAPLSLTGYHLLHLPHPDTTMLSYDVGAQQAYDLLLQYELHLEPTS